MAISDNPQCYARFIGTGTTVQKGSASFRVVGNSEAMLMTPQQFATRRGSN